MKLIKTHMDENENYYQALTFNPTDILLIGVDHNFFVDFLFYLYL